MNEVTYTAILLKATDCREYDRRVRLLTLEAGLIHATLKGVKRPGAKLKFGAQPFAFCQYTLARGKSGDYTVTGCTGLGDLYSIATDPDKYIIGSLLLEAADIAAYAGSAPEIFILLLGCLKQLAYTDTPPNVVGAHFLLKVTDLMGYADRYSFSGNLSPKNMGDALGALAALPAERLGEIAISSALALRALKMQAGRFSRKTDSRLNTVKMLHE